MTTYTEVTNTAVVYDTQTQSQTTWDGGNTQWDVQGNVSQTDWDVNTNAYTETTNTPTTWTEV